VIFRGGRVPLKAPSCPSLVRHHDDVTLARTTGKRQGLLLATASAAVLAAMVFAAGAGGKARPSRRRVPLALKLGYVGFVSVLVPVYWISYGPTNFLWLSDLALFATTASLLLENALPASMAAVGALPLELAWNIDLVAGGRLLGLAAYMFDDAMPAGLRALSIFHVALPPTLVWLLHRLGYDRRAFRYQALLVAGLLPLTYAVSDPAKNINWVFGPGREPQRRLPAWAYVAVETAAVTALAMIPAHMALKRIFASQPGGSSA
jgi:hypothetical protein